MSVCDDTREGKYKNLFHRDTTPGDIYRAETNRLESQFKADLEAEYQFVNHPKANKLFELAWNYGHSYSYSEVAMYYDELSELI